MRPHRLLAALAVASLALPAAAHAQFVEMWHSPNGQYHVYDILDMDGNGVLDLFTGENENSSGEQIAVRQASTGALLAQTTNHYQHLDLFTADLDGDGRREILFRDNLTQKQNCFTYAGPPGPITQRWVIAPTVGTYTLYLVDLDGNGHLYPTFLAPFGSKVEVYRNDGSLFGSFTPSPPMGGIFETALIRDFDNDGREEMLLMWRASSGTQMEYMVMLQSTSPVSVEAGPASLRAVELGSSFPNPAAGLARIDYTTATRGPVTLRLLDVAGREVRVLVDGEVGAGRHEVTWDGRDARGHTMPAGAYFYEITAGGQRLARQMVHLR